MATSDFHRLFNDSLDRCKKDDDFINRFYDNFLSSSAEVKEKFKKTDMAKQKKALIASLPYMTIAFHNPQVLEEIAIRHNKNNLDISPPLYQKWLDSMITAVSLTDDRFDAFIEEAWRKIMQPGINYLTSRYQEQL